jgi:hypothetical protein
MYVCESIRSFEEWFAAPEQVSRCHLVHMHLRISARTFRLCNDSEVRNFRYLTHTYIQAPKYSQPKALEAVIRRQVAYAVVTLGDITEGAKKAGWDRVITLHCEPPPCAAVWVIMCLVTCPESARRNDV